MAPARPARSTRVSPSRSVADLATDPRPAEPRKGRRAAVVDRGAETRGRLIAAALDVFGHKGFEGASTREIADAAGANLAAIVYHFGSKEALYHAVAEDVIARIGARLRQNWGLPAAAYAAGASPAGPVFADIDQRLDGIDAGGAVALLTRVLETFVDVIVASDEAAAWARFMVREQLDPTKAFDVIYRFMGSAHAVACRLVGAALGQHPDSLEVKLRTFTFLGQGLIFRVAQSLVLRRLGTERIGEAERTEIKRILGAQIRAILAPGGRS